MRKLNFAIAAIVAFALVGTDPNISSAAHGYGGFGFHFGGRNVHLDIGHPHGYRSHKVHRGRRSRHYTWHDTSHYDYHPGGYRWHHNHYDYVPGHWDYHQTGHWDRHRGYRH